MTDRVFVRPAAETDILEGSRWYEARSAGLGADFLRSVDAALAEIARSPRLLPCVHRDIRRAMLRRFPYAVFYVERDDSIDVVACLHVRRDPRRWEDRIEG